MASQHVRYMGGGRSSTVSDETLFRLRLPERPGSLGEFYNLLDPNWNISLFHYRNHGADCGRILVGLQIPEKSQAMMDAFIVRLHGAGIRDVIDETRNPVYSHFMRN